MDKIKKALNSPKLFWIASCVISLVMLICWFLGTNSVAKQAEDGAKNVDKHIKDVQSIVSGEPHPGDEWLTTKDKEIVVQKEKVREKWQEFYDKLAETVYVWPADELNSEFLKAVESPSMNALARPLTDDKKATDKPVELETAFRDQYRNSVRFWFPKLARRVEFGLEPGKTPAANARPLVSWGANAAAGNQNKNVKEIVDNHFKRWDNTGTPSTRQVLIAQEDYWVFKALCEIIIDANRQAKATGPHDTIVQTIVSMEIGQDAVETKPLGKGANRFVLLEAATAGKTKKKTGGNRKKKEKVGESVDEKLMHKRYVDAGGVGVPFDTKPDKEPFREYRLMPIQMSLVVDKSKMQYLLSAFAASTLPVEVQQLRINPEKGAGKKARGGRQNEDSGADDRFVTVVIQAVAYLIKDVDYIHLGLKPPEPVEVDAKKDDAKKDDAKKADAKKEDTKKEDTKKDDTKKEDTKKDDAKKEDASKPTGE